MNWFNPLWHGGAHNVSPIYLPKLQGGTAYVPLHVFILVFSYFTFIKIVSIYNKMKILVHKIKLLYNLVIFYPKFWCLKEFIISLGFTFLGHMHSISWRQKI